MLLISQLFLHNYYHVALLHRLMGKINQNSVTLICWLHPYNYSLHTIIIHAQHTCRHVQPYLHESFKRIELGFFFFRNSLRLILTHNNSITHLKTNSDQWAPGVKVVLSATRSSTPTSATSNEVRLMAKMRRKASIGPLLQIISCGSAPRMGSVQQLKTTCGVTFIA